MESEAAPTVEVTVDTRFSDLFWANFRDAGGRAFVLLLVAPILIAAAVALLLAAFGGPLGALRGAPVGPLVGLCAPMLIGAMGLLGLLSRSARARRDSTDGPVTLAFSADGYRLTERGFASFVPWSEIPRVQERRSAFWIYFFPASEVAPAGPGPGEPRDFFVVPKRCFRSDGDADAFREIVRRALGARARVEARRS